MKILINHEEKKLIDEIVVFLKTLTPEMLERVNIITQWEALKARESTNKTIRN